MIYSLNEIDAHCKKAARGAGFEWGYAEDIGKVARWLAAFELPGVSLVRHYLTQIDQSTKPYNPPSVTCQTMFHAAQGNLCPIQTGCYLADVLSVNADQQSSFEQLGFPLLLLPFLSRLSDQANLSVHYFYNGNQFYYGTGKLKYNATDTLTCDQIKHAKCIFIAESVDGNKAQVVGQNVNLNNYACKTYVPATEESRRGAGPSE